MDRWTLPPSMEPGDRVAIVATSGAHASAFPHVLELGLDRLRDRFDLDPVVFPSVEWSQEELRSSPAERARELERAFADPSIAGVIATIGGDDQYRVLSHLDEGIIVENPTRFYGYSDNTAFGTYLWNRGIVSFQGPMVMTELAMQGQLFEYTREHAMRAFFEDEFCAIEPPAETTDADLDWADPDNLARQRPTEPHSGHIWRGGTDPATGRTVGGSLETVAQLLLADREVPTVDAMAGTILALETSEALPPPWYVEQVLAGLGERGLLAGIEGVLVGRAKARSPEEQPPAEARATYREALRDRITGVIESYQPDAPIVFNVAVGHTHPTVALPLGSRLALDPAADYVGPP